MLTMIEKMSIHMIISEIAHHPLVDRAMMMAAMIL
jgi:hypothetical protein